MAAPLLLGSALAGCGSSSHYQRPLLAREIESIRATDGLFFLPQLRTDTRVDAYDNGWGLAALRAAGTPVSASITADQRSQLRAGIADSPLWGRLYLTLIDQAVPSARLIGPADLAAVAKLYRADGSFADPATSPSAGTGVGVGDVAAQIANTAAAVETLHTGGDEATLAPHRAALAGTLLRYLARPDQNLYTVGLAVRTLHQLGRAVPPGPETQIRAAAANWITQLGADLVGGASRDRRDLAYNAYGLAQLLSAAELGAAAPPKAVADAVAEAGLSDQLKDYQTSYYLAAATARFTTRAKAAEVVKGLLARRLTGGLLRPNDVISGSVQATYYATQVLLESGVSAESDVTAAALARAYDPSGDPAGLGQWFYAYSQAGGNTPPDSIDAALARIPRLLPAIVSAGNALDWAGLAELMTTLNVAVTAPSVHPWTIHDPESAYRAAQLVVQLNRAGKAESAQVGWVPVAALSRQLGDPAIANSNYRSLVMVRALQILRYPKPVDFRLVLARVRSAVGCPGLPHVLRDNAHDPECDLRTTAFALSLPDLAELKAPLS